MTLEIYLNGCFSGGINLVPEERANNYTEDIAWNDGSLSKFESDPERGDEYE